jgi:hypothetical protein
MGEEKEKKYFEPKTYVITSAQALGRINITNQNPEGYLSKNTDGNIKGAPIENLIKGLENYCKINDAELMVLTMNGMNASQREMHDFFKERDDVYRVSTRQRKPNDKTEISDMVVPPQNVDPTTGRDRFAQLDRTLIYAHSKQRLKPVVKSNIKLPRLLVTTGTCTYPNYNDGESGNHRGDAAKRDHTYGAVVLEIMDRRLYNLRFLQSQKDGKFVDMGQKFNGNKKPSKTKIEALVLGDIHWGDHEPKTIQANYEMMDYFKPKRLFLHDFLNGHSVNPHERKNLISRVKNFEDGRLNIEEELSEAYFELCNLAKNMGKREVNVVASNHPFFLDRYLERGEFIKEPWNAKIALKLGHLMTEGKDPVEEGIKMMGKVPSNVNFLKLKTDYKVWGWQLASHGHKGASGSRGSVKSRELGHGKSITGHTHAPNVLRNTVMVGTSTKLDLDYTEGGSSSWMAANGVLYEGGSVQLIPIINGKWRK